MSVIDMDSHRVEYVISVLRTEVTDLTVGFTKLTDAERLSDDVLLLSGVRRPLTEFLDETRRLADVIETHQDLMRVADSLHPTDRAQRFAELGNLIDGLARSLGDGRGAAGTAVEMAAFGEAERADVETGAETVLAWMEQTGSSGWSSDEFAALADDPSVPAHVRDAIAAIASEPVMMANLDRAGFFFGAIGAVSVESVRLFVATQSVSRGLGDRGVFDAFDSASDGDTDGRISWGDVHRLADDDSADPSVRLLAELIEDNPTVFDMLDTGSRTSADHRLDIFSAADRDGRISFGDVAATAVNTHAFEGRAMEARDFTMGLPSTNDHRDGSGDFLPFTWFSDAGVEHLARTALSATPSLSEQVGVVERLPESPGGIRNLAITEYYRQIGAGIDRILNPDGNGGALPLDAEGSTGANWFMHGAWASAGIRPVLVDNTGYFVITAGDAARQSMADGNQLLFGALAPAGAAFIEAFPPGTVPTRADIEKFFNASERADGRPIFVDGDRQMRDSFALMLDASTDPDPVTRQQTTFMSGALLGVHEQALVEPFVGRALDQGWDDGFRVLGDIFDADESFANGQIDPDLGGYRFEADRPLPVRHAHPDHVIGQDLVTTLNPTGITTVDIGGVTYDLSGRGTADVDLAGLAGWDDVPDHWEVDSQNIDPADWYADHGSARVRGAGPRARVGDVPGSTTGVPLPGVDTLPGAAVEDWKDYDDRMWTILNSFLQVHTLPGMAGVPGNGVDEADLSFIPGSGR